MKNRSSLNWIRWHRYWAGNPMVAAFIFLLLIVPLAIALKVLRIDPLKRSFEPKVKSYWIRRDSNKTLDDDIWRQD
tara:strand:+ start:115 stop:342 length:228 start_codon:yes stop_codon:yes gene_type:complete